MNNKNFDNSENTVYEEKTVNNAEEQTIYENNESKSTTENQDVNTKKSVIGKAVAALGFGILLGGTSSFVVGSTLHQEDPEPQPEPEPQPGPDPIVNSNVIPMATSINDEMSFSEAFAAARKEVGPGGVFEWRGNVYNTYYAEEWNAMSQEEKDEFISNNETEEKLQFTSSCN